jgi:hypothetical protein
LPFFELGGSADGRIKPISRHNDYSMRFRVRKDQELSANGCGWRLGRLRAVSQNTVIQPQVRLRNSMRTGGRQCGSSIDLSPQNRRQTGPIICGTDRGTTVEQNSPKQGGSPCISQQLNHREAKTDRCLFRLITQRSVVQIHPPQPLLATFRYPLAPVRSRIRHPSHHHKSHRAVRSELPHCWRRACLPTWLAYRRSSCSGWWSAAVVLVGL